MTTASTAASAAPGALLGVYAPVGPRFVAGDGAELIAEDGTVGRDRAALDDLVLRVPLQPGDEEDVLGRQLPEPGVVDVAAVHDDDRPRVKAQGAGHPDVGALAVGDHDRGLPHVAIPTTLSVAELAGGAGFTDAAGDKAGMRDVRLLLDSVIYDADLTLATPMHLWLSSGIRALDHAVEGFVADGAHPFSDVMALESIRRLFASLPRAKAAPDDIRIRTENQLAAWFSFTLPGASASGLSHAMGKQIGARHRIPHGVTSCLLMPHVMRYLARSKPERMALIAEATGSGKDAAADVEKLIGSLGLPQHIADYEIGEPELRRAADELGNRYPAADLLEIYLAAL